MSIISFRCVSLTQMQRTIGENKPESGHSRGFRPQPYSGRSANFVLNDSRRKLVATVGIEPKPLVQESEPILTELTHHLLRV